MEKNILELSVLSASFCCKPKTALKKIQFINLKQNSARYTGNITVKPQPHFYPHRTFCLEKSKLNKQLSMH